MGFAPLVAIVGLMFGMISLKLMAIVENAQVVVVRGRSAFRDRSLRGNKSKKLIAFAMSTQKLLFLRISIVFFARISSLIFIAEAMYPEKVVEGAALAMMKTVVISSRIRVATVRNGKHAINRMKRKKHPKRDGVEKRY
jgi:hypothetical protein